MAAAEESATVKIVIGIFFKRVLAYGRNNRTSFK